jgi:hypothetical protein
MTKYTVDDLLNGRSTDGIFKIEIEQGDYLKFLQADFAPSIYDDRIEVSAYSDPKFLECANNAGLPAAIDKAGTGGAVYATTFGPITGYLADLAKNHINTVVSATGLRSYTECVSDWTARLDDFVYKHNPFVRDIHLGRLTEATARAVARMLDSRGDGLATNVHVEQAGKKVTVAIGKLEEALKKGSKDTAAAIADLTNAIQSEQTAAFRDALAKDKARNDLQAKRDLIAGSSQALGLIARIALVNDPVLASRIEGGASAVARIADSIVQLAGPDPLNKGMKVLLSANIAGGALALVSLIGSKNSESAVLMSQLQGIQKQLSSMNQQMNARFDRLEKIIVDVTKHLDARLDTIDKRLVGIQKELEKLSQKSDNIYEISRESFSYVVSAPFRTSVRKCSRSISKELFSGETALKCFEDAVEYGLLVAPLRVISSGALYDPSLDVDEGMYLAGELSPLVRLGYLDAALRYAKREGLNSDFDVPLSSIVSPTDWADSVDILSGYLAHPEQFKGLSDVGYDQGDLIAGFREDIERLIEQGNDAKVYVESIRRAGLAFALDRYSLQVGELLNNLSEEVLSGMYTRDLGILGESPRHLYATLRGNTDIPFGTGGDMRFSIKYYDDKNYVVTHGPETGRVWRTRKRETFFYQMGELMGGGDEASKVQHFTMIINQPGAREALPFTLEFDTTLTEHSNFIREVNEPYLAGVDVVDYTVDAKGSLYRSFVKARSSEKLAASCQAVARSYVSVRMYAELLRSSYSEADTEWLQSLAELPGTDAKAVCSGLSLPNTSVAEKQRLDTYVANQNKAAFAARVDALKTAFLAADQSVGIDALETRIDALAKIIAENVAAAPPP